MVVTEVENITFEKVYFRGRTMDCKLQTKDDVHTIAASYKSDDQTNIATNEEGIKMQKMFELGPNQAVLAYRKTDGKLKYMKVENIKQKKPVMFMSRPKN